jgi:hypothetical protein
VAKEQVVDPLDEPIRRGVQMFQQQLENFEQSLPGRKGNPLQEWAKERGLDLKRLRGER